MQKYSEPLVTIACAVEGVVDLPSAAGVPNA